MKNLQLIAQYSRYAFRIFMNLISYHINITLVYFDRNASSLTIDTHPFKDVENGVLACRNYSSFFNVVSNLTKLKKLTVIVHSVTDRDILSLIHKKNILNIDITIIYKRNLNEDYQSIL